MAVEPVSNPKGVVQLQHTEKKLVVSERKLDNLWDKNAVNAGTIIIVEHIALLAAPFYFTWNAFWGSCVLLFLSHYIGISLCYHRNLSHKSFKLTKSLEYLFAYFGLHATQGDPILWVSIHRHHHQFPDSDKDPHSPIEGFWFSQITWMFQLAHLREKLSAPGKTIWNLIPAVIVWTLWKEQNCPTFEKNYMFKVDNDLGDEAKSLVLSWAAANGVENKNNVVDLQSQAYYRFLRRTYPLHIVGLALVLYIGGGLPHLIWGMGVRTTIGNHGTFIVGSVCHRWGEKLWNTKDLSKNNWMISLLGNGEGWHNNHHAFEFSARVGLEWWQVDVPWYIIKLLEYLGLATDVKVPTEIQKLKMSYKTHNDFHQSEKEC